MDLMTTRIITALPIEAAPLNEYFDLERKVSKEAYTLFANRDMSIELVIMGVGRSRVRAALESILADNGNPHMWVNIGFAGSSEFTHGALCTIKSVTAVEEEGGRIPLEIAPECDILTECVTVSTPTQSYPSSGVVDMELWWISQIITDDLYSLKVVSDTPEEPFSRKKSVLKSLIRHSLPQIETVITFK